MRLESLRPITELRGHAAGPPGNLAIKDLRLYAEVLRKQPAGSRDRVEIVDSYLAAAIEEARKGRDAGGIPIGSVLVIDGRIVGRGHNRRVQQGSAILHAEMDCLENAGRLTAADYRKSVLYSTLSPCDMCSGTALLYGIPRIVIGENHTFQGPEDYVRSRGVELEIVDVRTEEVVECETINRGGRFFGKNWGRWLNRFRTR